MSTLFIEITNFYTLLLNFNLSCASLIVSSGKLAANRIGTSVSAEKLDLKRDSIESAGAGSKQRVFSIDSEKGEVASDPEMKEEGEAGDPRGISRTSSRSSFKAVAAVARMGASMKAIAQPIGSVSGQVQQDEEGNSEDEDEEQNADSGYGDDPSGKSKPGYSPVLAAFTSGPKQKKKREQSIKQKIEKTTTQVFSAAKELYGKGQSTFKRTGGRQNSAGVQTSPTHTGSVISIPGLVETPDPPPESFYQEQEKDQNYFVYLISDSVGSNFRKDCIGRVEIPKGVKQVTLSDLRNLLTKNDDPTLKSMLRNNKSFRFVTETYRFVAQNEQAAAIDEVYGGQGIFVKFQEGTDVKLTQREGPSPALSSRIKSRQGFRKKSGRRRGARRNVKSDSSTDQEDLPPLKRQSRPLGQPSYGSDHHAKKRSNIAPIHNQSSTAAPQQAAEGKDISDTPTPRDPHHRPHKGNDKLHVSSV